MFWRKVCILLIDHGLWSIKWEKPSWPWSYASWIHNYPCNQCLSPLMLWFRISIRARCTTVCDKVCQWFATGRWFSPGLPVFSTNKTDRHDKTEILLKVALNTIKQTNKQTINKMRNITHHQKYHRNRSNIDTRDTHTLYNIIRNYIFRHISNICHNCNGVSKNSKLILLLVKETFSFMETLGSFIGRCFNIRYEKVRNIDMIHSMHITLYFYCIL
jgi:hypothetical protein